MTGAKTKDGEGCGTESKTLESQPSASIRGATEVGHAEPTSLMIPARGVNRIVERERNSLRIAPFLRRFRPETARTQEEFPLQSKIFSKLVVPTIAIMLTGALTCATALALDSKADLARAVRLFEQGDYLSAQEVLAGIDRDELSKEQQSIRDDYLNRAQTALQQHEKALRDIEDAQTAEEAGEKKRALELVESVLNNEYAPEAVRNAALALQRTLGGKPVQSDDTAPSNQSDEISEDMARARTLVGEGNEALKAGRYEEAERLFQRSLESVPGYPDAVNGLREVALQQQNISGSRAEDLLSQIRTQDAIRWQRTVAQYRDVETSIRHQVAAEQFDQANQSLLRARQIVDAGRSFADPPTKYESLSNELEALVSWVSNQERDYHSRKVEQTRRQIEQQRQERLRQDRKNRARQVDALMKQAMQHRKDGDLDSAVAVLRQVTVIDPHYDPARWMMDDLEELSAYRSNHEIRERFYKETRDALLQVEESKIPWHQELTYPNDWPEISARRLSPGGGSSAINKQLFAALDKPVRADFNGQPLETVLDSLAEAHKINITVNWSDLKLAGIDRNVAIDLYLPSQISLKRVLTEVLEQASGNKSGLGFDVVDGVVKVATRAKLDQETYTVVYDIEDLLQEIPMFVDSPLQNQLESKPPSDPSQVPGLRVPRWNNGDVEARETDANPSRSRRVKQIIDLIQDMVAPQSWTSRGGNIGTIAEINGQLVITQNSASQLQVNNLLGSLREQRAVQIAVEARFITVSSHYLEELGVDIDVVLNNGNAGFDFVGNGAGGAVTDPVLGSALLLPRTFSRTGFTQAVPNLGTANTVGPAIPQPFNSTSLVPAAGGGGGGSRLTPVPITSNSLSFTNPATLGSDVPGTFAGTSLGPAFGLFGSFLDNIQVDFLIRATQADSRTTVLTAPQLVLFNGQRSWVAVAVSQGFVSQLNPVVGQGAVAQAPQTSAVSSGASLDVQATVSADRRYVTMTLRPSLSRLLDLQTIPFSGGAAGAGFGGGGAALPAFVQLPTVSQQRISTTVSVPDGGTLLLGGQKLASETEIEAGVPVLSKIPIFKRAYSARTAVKDEQTLLILVKPKILIQQEMEELAFPGFGGG